MKFFTQSNLDPGNCWQTAIACILGVNPEELPPQHEIQGWPNEALDGWGGYSNVLNGYLAKHHGLMYGEVYAHHFTMVRPAYPEHILCGPTVRTPESKRNHCVVAVNGTAVWDTHPSRAGLTEVETWGLLGPLGPKPRASMERTGMRGERGHYLVFNCLCGTCGYGIGLSSHLSQARERAREAVWNEEKKG